MHNNSKLTLTKTKEAKLEGFGEMPLFGKKKTLAKCYVCKSIWAYATDYVTSIFLILNTASDTLCFLFLFFKNETWHTRHHVS